MSLPGAIGIKEGMTQIFDEKGSAVPVTVIRLLPMTVTQLKSTTNEGYNAVQVGYMPAKAKHVSKGEQGHLSKNNVALVRKLKEFKVSSELLASFEVGQAATPEFLKEIKMVNVTAKSIGKGFQGRIKLHNFSRGPMSHGSKSHRLPGSIGAGTTPGRVFRGLKMASHMGDNWVTVENLQVMLVEENVLLVKGAVPGKRGSLLTIRPRKIIGKKAG
jgi:large subunit ribosomal protein L3